MSDEVTASVQVPEEVTTTAQTGQVYNYENSIITSGVSQADLDAAIATRVAKAGDTMTGNLEMGDGLAVKLDGETDYEIKSPADSKKLTALASGKGVYLDGTNNEEPYYTDGTNSYKLVNTNDIDNGLIEWGEISGTPSNQTDLANYIKQVIGGTGVLSRPDYSAAVSVSLTGNQNSYTSSYTCPSDGYINIIPSSTKAIDASYDYYDFISFNINGTEIKGSTDYQMFSVSEGDVLTGKITRRYGQTTYVANTGLFFPQVSL